VEKELYVGNLAYGTTGDTLRQHFAQHGEVIEAKVIMDRETGRSRGFGFVKMDEDGAAAAIAALDGQELEGRNLKVNEARGKQDRPPNNRGRRF
jgi:RNA recognition motif-containing protein